MNAGMRKYSKAAESIGGKFGKLTVVSLANFDKFGNQRVLCSCDCGKEKIAVLTRLRKGDTTSCGCSRSENANKQLIRANKNNPKIKGKSEPRIATAKLVYRRYSDGDISFDNFMILSQKPCFYCGAEPSNKTNYYLTKDGRYSKERQLLGYFIYNGLDRVDSKLPHNLDNVVPCCVYCNKAKLDRTLEEFLAWVARVHNLHTIANRA
jgi:hypothetical protein